MSATPAPAGQGRPAAGTGTTAAVSALQAALAAENAVIFGYGVAGAHMTGRQQAQARRDWAVHEAARDTLSGMVTARGAVPVAAAVIYRLPFPVHDARSAVKLVVYLEQRLTTAYLGLVALGEDRLRVFGARSVRTAALRAAGWRGHTVAFPGLAAPPGRASSSPAGSPSAP